jgi:hypothetical protein
VPVQGIVGTRTRLVEALPDTRFDGELALPPGLLTENEDDSAHGFLEWRLADGALVSVPAFEAEVRVGAFEPHPATLIVLGAEPLIGVGIAAAFVITLERGRRVTVEE